MTREEEIYKGTQVFVGGYLDGLYDAETLAKKCAQWADEHPKSPWVSVEERLPKEQVTKEGRNWYSKLVLCRYEADGQVEAVEFRVDRHTEHQGVPLKDLRLKEGVLLVSITHGSVTEIPGGLSAFMEGDTIVIVTNRRGSLRQINDIFA